MTLAERITIQEQIVRLARTSAYCPCGCSTEKDVERYEKEQQVLEQLRSRWRNEKSAQANSSRVH